MDWIDLRSDTVTHPTPEMRRAMAEAEVGDDVMGEDPTVNRLEALAAGMLGKEAALFVPSGTMGNLAAVLAHCGRGDEIILGDRAHTFVFEGGGVSALGGVHPRTLPNRADGTLDLDQLAGAIRGDDIHLPISRLILLENTHNLCGGAVLTLGYTRQVADLAHSHGLRLHLDGARIFNAAAALGVPAAELAAPADSVTFCLSKGLCAPVGSVLCGSSEFVRRARRARKQLGGGMRQAGVLAAAGIVALQTMPQRLHEDHRRARELADGLRSIPGVRLVTDPPATNMVYLRFAPEARLTPEQLVESVRGDGIRLSPREVDSMRLVTHYWVDDAAVAKVIAAFERHLGST
jgi:threonine aldolase